MEHNTAILTKERIANPLLRRAMLYLEDKEWRKADEACERALDEEPENPYAYLIKLMVDLRVRDEQELRDYPKPIDQTKLFQKAVKFADPTLLEDLTAFANAIAERLEQQRLEAERKRMELEEIERSNKYYQAKSLMKPEASTDSLERAQALLQEIRGYQDAAEQLAVCEKLLHQRWAEAESAARAQKKKKLLLGSILTAIVLVLTVVTCSSINSKNAKRAETITRNLLGKSFTGQYHEIEVKQGSMVASRYEEIEETFQFTSPNTVKVKTKSSVDYDGSIITINGVKRYDSVDTREDAYTIGEVSVSFGGDIKIVINGRTYEVLVNSSDVPIGLKRGSTEYR